MGYLKDVEIALDLQDRDRERLKKISDEVTLNAANSSNTMDDLLKQYNLTEPELLAIRNKDFNTEKQEPDAKQIPAIAEKKAKVEETR